MMVLTRQQRGPSFRRYGGALLLAFGACLLNPSSAPAHPVPRSNHDRTIVVQLTPDRVAKQVVVTVHYRLEVDELTVVLEDMIPFRDEVQYDRFKNKPNEFYGEFTRIYAPILAGNLLARADGKLLKFTCASRSHRKTDEMGQALGHLRCDFVFRASFGIPQGHDGPQTFTFREDNYQLQNGLIVLSGYFGPALAVLPQRSQVPIVLATDGTWSVQVLSMTAPDAKLQAKPPQDHQPGDDDKLRQLALRYCTVLPTEMPDAHGGKVSQETAAQRRTNLQLATWRQAGINVALGSAEGLVQVSSEAAADAGGPLDLLQLFLSSEHGLAVALLLAGLIGAVHALTPGHGKTLVAAYLVGQRGTVGHAFILGVVTTLTHTGVVLAIALGLLFVSQDLRQQVANALGLVMGLALVCLGLWLLLQRMAGRADHFHVGGHGHHHHHGDHHHHHPAPNPNQKLGWYGLVVMGMTGGIAPCWDAVAMLVLAIGMNLLWLAVPMLLAFSAGLASVLVLIGVLVVHARRFLDGRWSEGAVVRALPIVSAVFITAMGVVVCIQGTQGAFHDNQHAKNTSAVSRP
jgi:nickel/cobalt exporter